MLNFDFITLFFVINENIHQTSGSLRLKKKKEQKRDLIFLLIRDSDVCDLLHNFNKNNNITLNVKSIKKVLL